jgi:hypothetical protein
VQDQQPAHEFVEGVAGDRQSGWLAALAGSAWTSVSSSSHAWLGLTSQDGCYCGGGKSVATLVADLHKRENGIWQPRADRPDYTHKWSM